MKSLKKIRLLLSLALILSFVVSDTILVSTIKIEAATVKISKKTLRLYIGKSSTLKVSGTKNKVIWSSSKKSVATVSSKGKVTAKKQGYAMITAKVGSKKYTCKVTVNTKVIEKTTPKPTINPTESPVIVPIAAPTASPTIVPTVAPTTVPTVVPTKAPLPSVLLFEAEMQQYFRNNQKIGKLSEKLIEGDKFFYFESNAKNISSETKYEIDERNFIANYNIEDKVMKFIWEYTVDDAELLLTNTIKQIGLVEVYAGSKLYTYQDWNSSDFEYTDVFWVENGKSFICKIPHDIIENDKDFILGFCSSEKVLFE